MKPHTSAYYVGGLLAVGLLVAACGGSDRPMSRPQAASTTAATTAAATTWRLVAIGDSDATGQGDPTGRGWVQRYADLIQEQEGIDVSVSSRAREGLTSDEMLSELKSDTALRTEVSAADVIVIGAGGADLNAGDDAWAAGSCSAEECYEDALSTFDRNMEAIAAALAQLRGSKPTLLRAITLPNALTGAEDVIPPFLRRVATRVGVFQAKSLRKSICSAMDAHGGRCIDVLTAFNGPAGTKDGYRLGWMNHDDCCYPSGEGQQLMAQLLVETGLKAEPLR